MRKGIEIKVDNKGVKENPVLIISYNKDIEALIVDAGWMALSRDRGTETQNVDYGYGQVCMEDGTIIKDLIVTNVQQEHGIIQVRKGSSCKLPNLSSGDLLRILPNHACATAAAAQQQPRRRRHVRRT